MPANLGMKNCGVTDSSPSDVYADDIDAEAKSYFHQMFAGQLTIDTMIQMLARFKESPEKREQSIFECMIGNLFEEYKFFPKYPERQLKIAAVLFGSLIKHQLVTHLTLGIALRGVLGALREPADSKMFVFGTKALEQFVDRLIEWPHYRNLILQISHLRGSHSELVAFIERALARISSGHSESEEGHSATADQQHGSIQAAATNMESQSAASASVVLSSSSGFTRPSQAITSARFGSALNNETLVAAAERRETPLEETRSRVDPVSKQEPQSGNKQEP